jgi:hypothetical protein
MTTPDESHNLSFDNDLREKFKRNPKKETVKNQCVPDPDVFGPPESPSEAVIYLYDPGPDPVP